MVCQVLLTNTDLQRSQDDLHATGAFGHHLFSTLLWNTQQSKHWNKLQWTPENVNISTVEHLLLYSRPWNNSSHKTTQDDLATQNCSSSDLVSLFPLHTLVYHTNACTVCLFIPDESTVSGPVLKNATSHIMSGSTTQTRVKRSSSEHRDFIFIMRTVWSWWFIAKAKGKTVILW